MTMHETQTLDADLFIRQKLFGSKKSSLATYRELVLGENAGLLSLWRYELVTTLFGPVPGALGLLLRRLFYRRLLGRVGRGVVIGRSVVIRHPGRVHLGKRVVIDDYCLIDARGAGPEGIVIGDDVILNRGSTIQAKAGAIRIGSGTNVGAGSVIVSMGGVEIGQMVGIGGGCYISGGAFRVEAADPDNARDQQKYTTGPIRIDDKCWLGMRAIVLDGVHMGRGAILGAGSLLKMDLPCYSVAAGVPAVVRKQRRQQPAEPAAAST